MRIHWDICISRAAPCYNLLRQAVADVKDSEVGVNTLNQDIEWEEASADITAESREQEIAENLKAARDAYAADNSQAVADHCARILELDENNAEAWYLLACFGGWESKQYQFDLEFAIDSAKHALSLIPEEERYEKASEIYIARKRQIALILESNMMMPSYTGAKQLHETMMWWKRLLQEIPYLNSELLQGEVTLCTNLCHRSKRGIMPGDRLVYTAYSTLNGKESYGETFRKAVEGRLEAEQSKNAEQQGAAAERIACLVAVAKEHLGATMAPEELKARLEEDRAALQAEEDAAMGMTNRSMYQGQIEELEARKAKLPPYKFFKIREIDAGLAALNAKLASIDENLEPLVAPLRECLKEIEGRLATL